MEVEEIKRKMSSIMYQKRSTHVDKFPYLVQWDLSQYTDIDTDHSYFTPYAEILNRVKLFSKPDMVEVGISKGGGLLFWKELLEPKLLCGIDIEYNIHGHVGNLLFDSEPSSIVTIIDDAYTKRTVERLKVLFPNGIDIVSEDGLHTIDTQIKFVELYHPLVKKGGVVIIEDIFHPDWLPPAHWVPGNDVSLISRSDVLVEYLEGKMYDFELYDVREVKNRVDDIVVAIYV